MSKWINADLLLVFSPLQEIKLNRNINMIQLLKMWGEVLTCWFVLLSESFTKSKPVFMIDKVKLLQGNRVNHMPINNRTGSCPKSIIIHHSSGFLQLTRTTEENKKHSFLRWCSFTIYLIFNLAFVTFILFLYIFIQIKSYTEKKNLILVCFFKRKQ